MTLWIVLIAIPMLFGLYAQFRVQSAYGKNSEIPSRGRITGREAAAAVMESAGIYDVEIVEVPGELSDHYDPSEKRLALSDHKTIAARAWPLSAWRRTRRATRSSTRSAMR